jgi:hypothetical protein
MTSKQLAIVSFMDATGQTLVCFARERNLNFNSSLRAKANVAPSITKASYNTTQEGKLWLFCLLANIETEMEHIYKYIYIASI